MRVLPSIVHEFRSAAERKVFDALRATDLGENAFALHSLNLAKHEYKRWAEIDFIVVWEEGAFALEVKGGRVSCHGGIWSFTNRFGETHRKSEGPFDQAKTAHEALRNLIAGQVDANDLSGLCWGWGVVFPDIEFDVSSVAWSRELIADHHEFADRSDLRPYLQRLARWWKDQGRGRRSPATPSALKSIQQAMRPDFDKVPALSVSINQAVESIVRLTDEQMTILDSIEENPRIICTGGAGTGKSVLAAECARREAVHGQQVLVLCHSPIFAAFLHGRISSNGTTVAGFDQIPKLLQRRAHFDVLVLDEAQDLLSTSSLNYLGQVLKGGLNEGRWRMFLDSNNQSGLAGHVEPGILERLKNIAAVHRLKRNCRNTEQIVLQTQLVTGADIGVAIIEGNGPPIEMVTVTDNSDTASKLHKRLGDWLDQGIRPGQISILSCQGDAKLAVASLPSALRELLIPLDASVAAAWPPRNITHSTVRDFKGLENHCIAVVDLERFEAAPRAIAELYVAMTRAHAGLWLAVPQEKQAIWNQLIIEHTTQLLEKGR